jgi:hypothetical protein
VDIVLLTLTVASLAAAAGFGVVVWRSRLEERRRSAARVAALAAAIGGPDSATHSAAPDGAGARPVSVTSMFETTSGGAVRGHPLMKMTVVAALAIVLVVIAAMANRDHAQPVAAPADAAPLELVSMRHTRDGSTLTVSGLVRNPRSGAPLTRIAAVVSAFDRGGSFVASGWAALDFTILEPGDESPFVVTVPDVADVGRYRVSFRTEAGILRHIDRRAVLQVSAN